jgi:hypothetical protein
MLEDIRNHSADPTPTEGEWMKARPFHALARVVLLGLVAAAIGFALPASDVPSTTQVAVAQSAAKVTIEK